MKAFDIMTRNVRAVSPATPLLEIAQLLVKFRISGVPVVDDKQRVVGMVSEGDLLRRAETDTERHHAWWFGLLNDTRIQAREYAKSHGTCAEEVMSAPAITVGIDADLATIAELFESKNIKRVPVVHEGALVGIISRRDLVRLLSERLAGARPRELSDREIEDRFLARLKDAPWGATSFVDANSRNGEVSLHGIVASEEHRQAIRVMAENIDGVRHVIDDLRVTRMPNAFV